MKKTPDEIKKGLECKKRVFADSCYDRCVTCELFIPCYGTGERCADALSLIQQLQAENAEKDARIQQLEAERDAAVEDLESYATVKCFACKYYEEELTEVPCNECKIMGNGNRDMFEWRGVQKG